jgi:catalase
MMDEKKGLTTASGSPIADNQNSLTLGARGPLLVRDWPLFEKHTHFNRERIPERVVHAKGSGAYAKGERFRVKLHFKSMQGIKNLADAEAAKIVGEDRESHQRDLFEAIERGDFPRWRLCVQIMPEKDAEKTPYNPFDLTKVWPHKDYPLIEVGVLELNRNPENYFADIEQAAFEPSNVAPGIGFSRTRCCSSEFSPTRCLKTG